MAAKRVARKLTKAELADPQREARWKQQAEGLRQVYSAADRLPKNRKLFILDIAANGWMARCDKDATDDDFRREGRRWERLRHKFLREVTNPLELHFFATNWNCDEGMKPIHKIVTSPHCDAGTALWLYWVNDPYFAMAFRTVKDADGWEKPIVHLSRTIERRFRLDNFATSKFPFDPEPWTTNQYDTAEWVAHKIPDAMYISVGIKTRKKESKTNSTFRNTLRVK